MEMAVEELVSEILAVAEDSKRLDPFPSALSCVDSSPLVDRALGMMGYNAGTVYPQANLFRIQALACILSSSTFHGEPLTSPCACEQSSEFPKERRCGLQKCICGHHTDTRERVEFGTCISRTCIERIAESCKAFVTYDRGSMVLLLIEALLKVTTELCSFRKVDPSSCRLYRFSRAEAVPEGVVRLLELLRKEKLYDMLSPISRSRAWRLHPTLLKQDIAEIVFCALDQPELALEHEFRHRLEWRNIVAALTNFPLAFSETYRLLENWSSTLTSPSRVTDVQKELSKRVENEFHV